MRFLIGLFLCAAAAGMQGHPRLVFGKHRTFDDVRKLYRTDAAFRAILDRAVAAAGREKHPAPLAALWVATGEERWATGAVEAMEARPISESGNGSYSDVWSYALAYDWLYGHAALTPEKRGRVEAAIRRRLETELSELDGSGMALWHGRNQAANNAIVAALAIADLPGGDELLRRATAHYIGALRALEFSEGWPEGASYWIYNRAGPYAVAADCWLTATGEEAPGGVRIREVMRKIGLWSIYQFTPAGFFEPYGDSSGSLRLGQTGWWELSVDYFARISRDAAVMAGGDWFRNQSPQPYGKLPWYVVLAYDPSPRAPAGYDANRPELWMRKNMAQAMLFGRKSLGVAFFRGAWGDPDELYATFKAGDLLAHHDHYDVGHFGIQYGGLLAPQTGLYGPGGYTGKYRLGYSVQSVAHNCLLIESPLENSMPLRKLKAEWTALSGGQRVIRPTGFSCVSVEDFEQQRNAGPHLERADITEFESVPGEYDYIAADLTAAYNSTRWAEAEAQRKVSRVTREFVYLRRERAFVIYDRVDTTLPEFVPKFLLHTLSKPLTANERVVKGSADDGIVETSDHTVVSEHERGRLTQMVLLPRDARVRKIGGVHFNSYVAGEGGVQLEGGDVSRSDSAQAGLWRVEVEPARREKENRFLNVLLPRLKSEGMGLPRVALEGESVRVGGTVVTFADSGGVLVRRSSDRDRAMAGRGVLEAQDPLRGRTAAGDGSAPSFDDHVR